jgi:hypothetical protein
MKPRKKFRGRRRYFRNLRRKAASFELALDASHWYDLWHHHFDWFGHGRFSVRHRREHLAALCVAFERALAQLAAADRPAQVFLSIAPERRAEHDAIYVHTPNPNRTPFPFVLDDVRWGITAPDHLRPFMRSAWEIGEILRPEPGWLVVRPRDAEETREPRIAFDSQTVTYFLRANRGTEFPPRDAELTELDRQHLATIRLAFAYYPVVVPTAEAECLAIPEEERAYEHGKFLCSFFLQANRLDGTDVEGWVAKCRKRHKGPKNEKDCRVVAEALCEGMDALVTNDSKLRRALSPVVEPMLLLTPVEAWERFARASVRQPAPEHPLADALWWRW